jgi:tRNA threonylcarbamoyladenosine biosynthesis protein TsaE
MTYSYSLAEISHAARKLVTSGAPYLLWTFEGEMGSGKTTLIRAVCQALGVSDEVSSPTFSLVNEYRTITGETIFHFDFYRIKNLEEVYDIGYEDYFFSGNICLIEWPDKIAPLLEGENVLRIRIEKNGEQERTLTLS